MAEQFRFQQLLGIAAQLTETNTPSLRLLWRCRNRDMTSLPVPDSPRISTVASDGAICAASSSDSCITGSETTTVSFSSETASSTAAISTASGGSGRYSLAPARIALTARPASLPMPNAMTGVWMRSTFSALMKLPTSRRTSIMTRSAPLPLRRASSAVSPSSAWLTLAPRFIAIFPASVMCPSSVPTSIRRMVTAPS